MSNNAVGNIYHRIIADVIESSQIDFEECAVDQGTLDELRQVWQQKLSSLQVAQFPWDPQPARGATASTSTGPSNGHGKGGAAATSSGSGGSHGAKIKAEPGLDDGDEASTTTKRSSKAASASIVPLPTASGNAPAAMQRAASLIQQKFGAQGNSAIGALQSQLAAQDTKPPRSLSPPTPPEPAAAQRISPIKPDQTDGGADVPTADDVDPDPDAGRRHADRIIRQRVEAMGLEMEAGGLLLPLAPHARTSPAARRRTPDLGAATATATATSTVTGSDKAGGFDGPGDADLFGDDDDDATHPPPAAQPQPGPDEGVHVIKHEAADDNVDDDDEEEAEPEPEATPDVVPDDEDAINSDLDDPDDGADENGADDDTMLQIMLCMYDKVQRTKNKWKCTLKDGVLTVGGREYVFNKATGEFEW
ncbi:MAG: transcription factor IIA subunit alpha [Phylliscum demangeonii]|nr:MAG: transcription factor IIA subunit alpha [Phylliscum demangeonii]